MFNKICFKCCLIRHLLLLLLSRFSRVWLFAAPMDYAAAKLFQSCPTLCNPIDGSPPGSPVPGILQARTLKWVAISFSNAWKWKVKLKSLSCDRLIENPWTAAHQAPPSMGFSRQEYWSGLPLTSPIQIWPKPNPIWLYIGSDKHIQGIRSECLKNYGCDGIPVELFKILKDDVVTVLHSICQQIWKT